MKNIIYTKEEVHKKFRNKYIEFVEEYDYSKRKSFYRVLKVYDKIHENTTLGQDVGTSMEYCR